MPTKEKYAARFGHLWCSVTRSGIWAAHANRKNRLLEPGDIEEGLNAAAAVGDDRLQEAARGRVSPESFTHGSARQRADWFRRGLESGELRACDTFAARL